MISMKQWHFVIILLATTASIAVTGGGAAHAQSPDTSVLHAGAAHVGLAPGQRVRYAVLNRRIAGFLAFR